VLRRVPKLSVSHWGRPWFCGPLYNIIDGGRRDLVGPKVRMPRRTARHSAHGRLSATGHTTTCSASNPAKLVCGERQRYGRHGGACLRDPLVVTIGETTLEVRLEAESARDHVP
jgi:hypothetical protein